MAAESKLEKYLRKRVKKLKGEMRKVRWIGRHGAPDDLVWIPNWLWPRMPEIKAPGKPLEDHQVREHKRLRRMGVQCYKLDSEEDIERFLRLR